MLKCPGIITFTTFAGQIITFTTTIHKARFAMFELLLALEIALVRFFEKLFFAAISAIVSFAAAFCLFLIVLWLLLPGAKWF